MLKQVSDVEGRYNYSESQEQEEFIYYISDGGKKFNVYINTSIKNRKSQEIIFLIMDELGKNLDCFDKFKYIFDIEHENIYLKLTGKIENNKQIIKFVKKSIKLFESNNNYKRNPLYDISIGIFIGIFTTIVTFLLKL